MILQHIKTRLKPSQEQADYEAIARVYDAMMAHVEYDTWADYITTLLDKWHSESNALADAGCGTGSMMLEMQQYGFDVCGFDKSLEMVKQARTKVKAPVWQADLKDCVFRTKQDVILCLYDTLQYLTETEIQSGLKAMYHGIKSDGLVIFDAVTESHVLRYWANVTEKDGGEDWDMVRHSWYDRSHACQHSEMNITFHERGKRFHEHHQQYMYSLETWKRLCCQAGFEIAAILGDFTLEPGTEQSDRIHFVLKRGKA